MRLLLERQADGIGDWLFMLAAMLHVNRSVRECELLVNFNRVEKLPKLVTEAYYSSDVRWSRYDPQTDPIRPDEPRIRHVIYPTDRNTVGEPYIKGMVDQIARMLTRPLEYEPGLVPLFRGSSRPMRRDTLAPDGHVLVCPSPKQIGKDWGKLRYEELAAKLAFDRPGMAIVSVGAEHEEPVATAGIAMHGLAFPALIELIFTARAIVCGENCLAVLAGWLSTPAVVIYLKGDPRRLPYPSLTRAFQPDVFQVRHLVNEILEGRTP